jgi:hypothetical protein
MKTKYVVALSESEREFVQKIVNDKTTAPTFKKTSPNTTRPRHKHM